MKDDHVHKYALQCIRMKTATERQVAAKQPRQRSSPMTATPSASEAWSVHDDIGNMNRVARCTAAAGRERSTLSENAWSVQAS